MCFLGLVMWFRGLKCSHFSLFQPSFIVSDIQWRIYFTVNGKWSHIYIALFQSTDHSRRFTACVTFTHSHTHSHTDGWGCHARCHKLIRSNLGFSILPKDTSTYSQGSTGVESATFRLLDDPLYHLSHSHPNLSVFICSNCIFINLFLFVYNILKQYELLWVFAP